MQILGVFLIFEKCQSFMIKIFQRSKTDVMFCSSLMSVQGDSSFYNSSFSKYLFDIVVSIL